MSLTPWVRRHRGLAAFAAGVLLTLVALAAVGYFVLADQRRSARVLAAALSQALKREVRIDRVTDLGTERVVMRGVHLPRDGGWAADVVAERVEATGPLLAAVRGDEAPLRLVVTRPRVEAPAGGGAGLAALEGVRQGLASFLAASTLLDVTLTGGSLKRSGSDTGRGAEGVVEFELVLRKWRDAASAELTLGGRAGAPLVLTADARMESQMARVTVVGRGSLAAVSQWLPSHGAVAIGERSLALRLDLDLAPSASLSARGGLTLGDAVVFEGEATVRDGALRVAFPRATADLAVAAAAAGLGWRPTGRAELADVTLTWRPDAGGPPTIAAAVHVSRLEIPAAGIGTDILGEQVDGRVMLEPVGAGLVAQGEARVGRLRVAGLDVAPGQSRYRLSLDTGGTVSRADLDGLTVRVAGASLQGTMAYEVTKGRVDVRLGGETVEAGELVRRVAPGWLGDGDRVRVTGLRVTGTGLDPAGLRAGTARLEASGLAITRPDGELATGRATAGASLAEMGAALSLEADGVKASVPVFRGVMPRLTASVDFTRKAGGGLELKGAMLSGRDREGRELLTAGLRPAAGRIVLSARAPELQRLGGLWPDVPRRVNGSASLDVELAGPGFRAADGRLALKVTDAELAGGKVSVRDLVAEVPLRRGTETPGMPAWGRVEVSELIGYGLVVRDLTTPARLWNDRLSLNDLTYALYSGEGKGWAEVEIEPAGLFVRGELTGSRVRVEEFISAYGIRGGTMTGLLGYDLDIQYRAGRVGVNGRFEVPEGGTVNIELLNRLLAYAGSDPTGVLRSALQNLRAFEYKHAEADVISPGDDIRVSLVLKGRERLGIFPPRVREINVRNLPLSFLARQFGSH